MSSLRQIKDRISSVTATQKLTASMKLVAVSRLKKKHAEFLKTVPFADEMNRVVRRLVRSIRLRQQRLDIERPGVKIKWPRLLNGNGKDKRYVVFVITSDEGLSGASQVQVTAHTKRLLQYLKNEGKEATVYVYGTRGVDILKKAFPELPVHIIKQKETISVDLYNEAERIAYLIVEAFYQNQFDVCLFVYNQFKSVVSQRPMIEQVVPNKTFLKDNPWNFLNESDVPDYVKKDTQGQAKIALKKSDLISAIGGANVLTSLEGAIFKTQLDGGKRSPDLYDYEPSDMGALLEVLPRFLAAYVYRALLEAEVSDNAARLMAMDNASRNAKDMLFQLDRSFKRARQSRITTEIAEVSSGIHQKENSV